MPKISDKSFQVLIDYLKDHSESIAKDENDFGDLKEIYQELCNEDKQGERWILYGLFVSLPEKTQSWTKIETYKNKHEAFGFIEKVKTGGTVAHAYLGYKIIHRACYDKTVFNSITG